MSADIEQAIIRHSVEDVIRILENEPVRLDLVGQITAAQIMNRVSIAHLSIERALKFLITRAGGSFKEEHHLGDRLRELIQHDRQAAEFLNHAFQVAVQHYRFNPNVDKAGHLKSLESYLDVAASKKAFNDLRYWELHQSLDEVLVRQLYLALHMELLHAVLQLLRGPAPTDTVATRVERAVKKAMWSPVDLTSSPGTPKEDSVRSYSEWCRGFASWSDALAEAVRQRFMIGDEFANGIVVEAYRVLLKSTDPAVSYFAGTLDVLPREPRDVKTLIDWIGTPPLQAGFVKSPSVVTLGQIERRWDGLWNITPFQAGFLAVAAKAESQTDARGYLAASFSQVANMTVNGEQRRLRIVGNEETYFEWSQGRVGYSDDPPAVEEMQPRKVVFWDADHGLMSGNQVSIRLRSRLEQRLVHVLQGVVAEIDGHVIHLVGDYSDEINKQDADQQTN